jgi:hypothetical protein
LCHKNNKMFDKLIWKDTKGACQPYSRNSDQISSSHSKAFKRDNTKYEKKKLRRKRKLNALFTFVIEMIFPDISTEVVFFSKNDSCRIDKQVQTELNERIVESFFG